MTDKEKLEKLKQYLIDLRPYCNNCGNREDELSYDECNRKSFSWKFDESILSRFE